LKRNLKSWFLPLLFALATTELAGEELVQQVSTRSETTASDLAISSVVVSPSFINTTLGQKANIEVAVVKAGIMTVTILDRDRFPIRVLRSISVKAGKHQIAWDGKDEAGLAVPDEAYSVRVELKGTDQVDVHDPSDAFVPIAENPASASYNRVDGVLAYTLSLPSRVHIQAGQVNATAAAGEPPGPVLKTILDRQPRVAGALVERWNGFDESGSINVAELKGFVISIAATSLPGNSIITTGNRSMTFFQYAQVHRTPAQKAIRPLTAAGHEHHKGLNTFEDHAPALALGLEAPRANDAYLLQAGRPLRLSAVASADRSPYFFSQPATLYVFVDERSVAVVKSNENPTHITIDAKDLPPGEHRIAVNWASAFGPVAVRAARVVVGRHESSGGGRP